MNKPQGRFTSSSYKRALYAKTYELTDDQCRDLLELKADRFSNKEIASIIGVDHDIVTAYLAKVNRKKFFFINLLGPKRANHVYERIYGFDIQQDKPMYSTDEMDYGGSVNRLMSQLPKFVTQ